MPSYMLFFTLAIVLFLVDARPHHRARSAMKDDDAVNEIIRLLKKQENIEGQLHPSNEFPELVSVIYQERKFRQ